MNYLHHKILLFRYKKLKENYTRLVVNFENKKQNIFTDFLYPYELFLVQDCHLPLVPRKGSFLSWQSRKMKRFDWLICGPSC